MQSNRHFYFVKTIFYYVYYVVYCFEGTELTETHPGWEPAILLLNSCMFSEKNSTCISKNVIWLDAHSQAVDCVVPRFPRWNLSSIILLTWTFGHITNLMMTTESFLELVLIWKKKIIDVAVSVRWYLLRHFCCYKLEYYGNSRLRVAY